MVMFAWSISVSLRQRLRNRQQRDPGGRGALRYLGGHRRRRKSMVCKIWYLISRTVSEDDAHRDNIDDRSVDAVAVKPRALGARYAALGLDR
jgi:hypothetical protein